MSLGGCGMLRSDGEYDSSARAVTLSPSAHLAAIVGAAPLTRADALDRLWDYIRANGLQNPNDKRQIVPDDALAALFGTARITMFDITQHLDAHLR